MILNPYAVWDTIRRLSPPPAEFHYSSCRVARWLSDYPQGDPGSSDARRLPLQFSAGTYPYIISKDAAGWQPIAAIEQKLRWGSYIVACREAIEPVDTFSEDAFLSNDLCGWASLSPHGRWQCETAGQNRRIGEENVWGIRTRTSRFIHAGRVHRFEYAAMGFTSDSKRCEKTGCCRRLIVYFLCPTAARSDMRPRAGSRFPIPAHVVAG